MPVTVGPSTLTINHDRQFLISQRNATMAPQDDVGFYARDTRFVSGYGVTINGRLPRLLDAITVEHFSARYEFMTPHLPARPAGQSRESGLEVGIRERPPGLPLRTGASGRVARLPQMAAGHRPATGPHAAVSRPHRRGPRVASARAGRAGHESSDTARDLATG